MRRRKTLRQLKMLRVKINQYRRKTYVKLKAKLNKVNKSRKTIFPFVIGTMIILIPIFIFTLKNRQTVKAAWMDDNFAYRTKLTVTNNGAVDTNKKVKFDIDTATLITAGKMQATCADSRFTDINGKALRYYLDSTGGACNTNSTDYYILLPTINAGTTIIYHYYGHPSIKAGSEIRQFTEGTFSPSSTESATEEKATGPVSYWQFDEGYGSIAHDTTSNGNSITLSGSGNPKIEQQINLMDQDYYTASTSYAPTDNSLGIITWDSTKYSDISAVYLDVEMKNIYNCGAYVSLYTTAGVAVSGTEVSLGGNPPWTRVRSGDIKANLVDNTQYTVRVRTTGCGGAYLKSTRLIVLQSGTSRITNTETSVEVGNAEGTSSASYTTIANKKIYNYEGSKFSPTPTAYFESTFRPASPMIEQQFGIVDQSYHTVSTSYTPTDNSLGIFRWSASNYTGITAVYFDVEIKNTYNCSAYASLYTLAGVAVSGSEVGLGGNPPWTRVRSGDIKANLVDGTEYSVRVRTTGCGTANLRSARIIVQQSDGTKLSNTELGIDIGDTEYQTTGAYSTLTNKKIYNYDSSKFTPAPTAYFESTFRPAMPKIEQQISFIDQNYHTVSSTDGPTDNSMGIIRWTSSNYTGIDAVYFEAEIKNTYNCSGYASIYTIAGVQVTGSELGLGGNSPFTRIRSSDIKANLVDGTEYTVRVRSTGCGPTTIKYAKLIVLQSDNTKLSTTEHGIDIGNTEYASTGSYATLTDKKIYRYDSSKFTPTPTAYFESTFRPSTPMIEQQINIIDQTYTTTSNAYSPSDNSLGIIKYTSSNYTGINAVYFEAEIINGYPCTTYAALYTTGGTMVTGTEFSLGGTYQPYTRRRSADIKANLVDGTEYTVRLRASSNGCSSTSVRFARLVIVQSDATKLSNTETPVEVGNNETTTSTSYTQLTDPKLYYYDSTKFTPAPTAYFEATISNNTSTQTASAALSTDSCSTQVSGTEVTSTSDTTWTRVRSSSFTLSSGSTYSVCLKGSANTARISNAKIVLVQSDGTNGISATELVRDHVITLATDTNSGYDLQYYRNVNEPLHFGVKPTIYHEATMKTSAGTGYINLYNNSAVGTVANSEITTTSTTYTRVRSSDIYSSFDRTAIDEIDPQIRNSASSGNTTSVASDRLIIQLSNIPTAGPSGAVQLYNETDGAAVSGSEVTSTTGSFTRVRSSSITLTTEKDYVVQYKDCILTNAKIILVQSDGSSGISAMELIHPYVATTVTDTDSTYTQQYHQNVYDPLHYGVKPVIYHEATMKTSAGTGYIQLANDSAGGYITNSELTTASTSYARVRSASDLYSSFDRTGVDDIDPYIKNSAASGNTTTVTSNWLVIQLSRIPTTGPSGSVQLYNDTDGTAVSGSEVTSTTGAFNRVRSSAITLASNKDYVVQLKDAMLVNAKIILVQSDGTNGISATELIHPYITTTSTDTNNGYDQQYFSNIYELDHFGIQPNIYYEATMKTSAGTGYTQLYNYTTGGVSGTEITTASTSYTRVRTASNISAMTLHSTVQELDPQIKNSAASGNTTSVSSSWLVIQLSNIPTNGPTGAVQLYNETDSLGVANSEVSSTNASIAKMRTNRITLTSNKEYVVQTKSAILISAKIILQQASEKGVLSLQTLQQYDNSDTTTTSSSYGNTVYTNNYNPDNFFGGVNTYYYESTIRAQNGTTAYAQNTATTNSQVTTTSTSYVRQRSADISANMPLTATDLETQIKNGTNGSTTEISNAWLIIDISGLPIDVDKIWYDDTMCVAGKCAALNGTSNRWVRNYNSDKELDPGTDSFSLSLWVKHPIELQNAEFIISRYNAGGYKLYFNSLGNICFGISDDANLFPKDSACSSQTYNDLRWHYINAVKTDTTNILLYVDGIEVGRDASLSTTNTISGSSPTLYLGIDSTGSSGYFSGFIDELKYYNYPKTATQISVESNARGILEQSGVNIGSEITQNLSNNLMAEWKLDERAANTCEDGGSSDSCDTSKNKLHGYWQDNATPTQGRYSNGVAFDGTNDRIYVPTGTNSDWFNNWFDQNWQYRMSIDVVNNTAVNLVDYQTQMTIAYNPNMQTDFDDLRFTNLNGSELNYYIASKTDGVSATVWVKLRNIPANDSATIYMYYGNGSVSTASSDTNTFLFYDDFSGAAVDATKWTTVDGTGITVSGGVLRATSTTGWLESIPKFTKGKNIVVESKVNHVTMPSNGYAPIGLWLSTSNTFSALFNPSGGNIEWYYNSNGGYTRVTTTASVSNILTKLVMEANGTTSIYEYNNDTGVLITSTLGISNSIDFEPIRMIRRPDNAYTGQAMDARWDWVRVRAFASTEPTVNTGVQETYGGVFQSPWKSRLKITFNNAASATDLNNFPVLVKLDSTRIDYTKTKDSGQDIFFADSNNTTVLSHEIESWDETGSSYVWVKVPNIPAGSTTDYIYMYYNSKKAVDEQNPASVWNSNYTLVQHLSENGLLTNDATGNYQTGTKLTSTEPIVTTSGRIGNGQNFDGTNDYIAIPSNTALNFTSAITMSGWFKADTLPASPYCDHILIKDDDTSGSPAWGKIWGLSYCGNSQLPVATFYTGTTSLNAACTTAIQAGQWYYITGTFSTTSSKCYINGTNEGTTNYSSSTLDVSSKRLFIGAGRLDNGDVDEYIDGTIDEVRLSGSTLGSDWIRAEYLTTTDSFNTYGTEEVHDIVWSSLNSQFTTVAWVNATTLDSSRRSIISRGNSPTQSWFIQNSATNPGKLEFSSDGSTNIGTSKATLETNAWYQIIMTADLKKTRLYINGLFDTEINNNGSIPTSGDIGLGNDPSGGTGWNGKIDNVKIYNTSLNSDVISKLYNQSVFPIAYYPLEETSGITVVDMSGNGYIGVWNAQDNHVMSAKFGAGGTFDGTSDVITVGYEMYGVQSLAFWINPNSITTGLIELASGVYCRINAGTLETTGITSPKIYINGVQSSTVNLNSWQHVEIVTDTPINATAITIGLANGTQYYNGTMDEIKIYDYARSPKEVVQDMNANHPTGGSPIASQTIYWAMDEQSGTTLNNSNSAQASLTGTISGASWKTGADCKVNGCLSFTNTTDNVTGGDVAFVDGLSGLTFSFWIKPTTLATTKMIFSKANTATQRVFAIQTDASSENDLRVYVASSASDTSNYYTTTALGLVNGTWSQLTVVYDGTAVATERVKVYKDGKTTGGTVTGTIPTTLTSATSSELKIGRGDDAGIDAINAVIDEFKVYNSAINGSDAKIEANAGVAASMGGILGNQNNEGFDGNPPVAWWKFDENSGTSVNDLSGNENTGTLGGGNANYRPIWTPGKNGAALNFDGVNDLITVPDKSVLRPGDGSWTMEAWIKPPNVNQSGTIIDKRLLVGYPYTQFSLGIAGSNSASWPAGKRLMITYVENWDTNNRSGYTNIDIADGNWHHVVGIADKTADTIKAYVDGKIVAVTVDYNVGTWPNITNTDLLAIGSMGDNNLYYSGLIDDVKIYNYARTPAQIAYDYNRGAPIAQFDMDECSGTTVHNSSLSANGTQDSTINGTITLGASDQTASGDCTTNANTAWYNGRNGKYSGSLNFDGTDDYITIPDTGVLDSLPTFSISMWLKATAGSGGRRVLISKGLHTSSPYRNFFLEIDTSNKLSGLFEDSSGTDSTGVISNTTIALDTWYHVIYVVDSDNSEKLYVNGKLETSSTNAITPTNSNDSTYIGDYPNPGYNFTGQMDSIKIFNYALNTEQVKRVYNEGFAIRYGQ